MAITYMASPSDMARLRLAPSPIGEAVISLRAIGTTRAGSRLRPFTRYAQEKLKGIDIRLLRALIPNTGYVPDVLTLAPRFASSFPSQMDEFRAISPTELSAQVAWMASDPGTSPRWKAMTSNLRTFAEQHPERALIIVAGQLEHYWHVVLKPHWPRISEHLDRDIRDRTPIAERGGMDLMLSSISEQVMWSDETLLVKSHYEYSSVLEGGGIVFVPSVFAESEVLTMLPPMVPMVVYPKPLPIDFWAGGAGSDESLANLLGRVRAQILQSLHRSMTTGEIALVVGVTPGAVSQHLLVLRESGLVASEKRGRNSFHALTQPGEDLITAATATPFST